jgi:hypothetical protein
MSRPLSAANPSTPLSSSTLPKDILPSARANRDDHAAMASLVISRDKLRELETEIASEAAELGALKESIQRSDQLAQKMIRMMGSLQTHIDELETSVMPVYRQIQSVAQVNDNVESSISLVEQLLRINDQVRRETTILLPSPTAETLLVYLDSMTKVAELINALQTPALDHCKMSLERAQSALHEAQNKTQTLFHDLHQSLSSKPLFHETANVHDTETLHALKTIADYFKNDRVQFKALQSIWIEVRSNTLAARCEPFFAAALSTARKEHAPSATQPASASAMASPVSSRSAKSAASAFPPSSCPLGDAMREAIEALLEEDQLAHEILSSKVAAAIIPRSTQILRDLAMSTVESILSAMKKACARREYADQVYLLSPVHVCNQLLDAQPSESIANTIFRPIVRMLTLTVGTIFTDLFGEVRGTNRMAIERPFAVPETANVYELTSMVLNILKRLAEYGPITDAILTASSSSSAWDGTVCISSKVSVDENASLAPSFPVASKYYNDVLGALESCLDTRSRQLRKPMQTLLFQLNNYNYILKNLKNSSTLLVPRFVEESVLRRYEQIIETLLRSFMNRYSAPDLLPECLSHFLIF